MKKIRLDRYLANCKLGSRKEVKNIIKKGHVTVNGKVIKDPSFGVHVPGSAVEVNGQEIVYREFCYLMMNKPAGVISATTDDIHTTVVDLIPEPYRSFGLFPVGRLDKDTEGLLILTNDGQLAHKLLSPKKHVPKTYFAVVSGRVTAEDIEIFKKGIQLEPDFTTLPSELVILEAGDQSKIQVTIYEGKYHQVKRMFQHVSKKVLYLKRTAMAKLELDDKLKPGEARELTEIEVDMIKQP